jgi:uncharacterized RmlC-like cupin family protein
LTVPARRQHGRRWRNPAIRATTRVICTPTLEHALDNLSVVYITRSIGRNARNGVKRYPGVLKGRNGVGVLTAQLGGHQHDQNETSLYVVSGTLLLEFEASTVTSTLKQETSSTSLPTVHRESKPTDEPSLALIARAGGGIPTVHVAL